MNTDNLVKPVSIEELREGAKMYEFFYLRPKKMAEKTAVVRMRINKGWSGWKLKDELVESLGLEIGDTMNTEVSVLEGPGYIENVTDTDLFASGEAADWLFENEIKKGSVIDGRVKFVYSKAPVGGIGGREIWKASLVLLEGISVNENSYPTHSPSLVNSLLQSLVENNI